VVAVADREGVRQGPVERKVLLLEVPHEQRNVLRDALANLVVGRHPRVHLAAVPRGVRHRPRVIAGRRDPLRRRLVAVEVKREQVAVRVRGVRLIEDTAAGGQRDGTGIGIVRHAGHGAEVVVEAPVLLHEQDDVLDVAQRGRFARQRRGQGLLNVGRQRRRGHRRAARDSGGAEEAATGEALGRLGFLVHRFMLTEGTELVVTQHQIDG
jgi:hypothetical protein